MNANETLGPERLESRIKLPAVHALHLQEEDAIPNSALPLLIYEQAVDLPAQDPAGVWEQLFSTHGWGDSWRDGVYPYHHFHSTAHEVLGVFSGSATIQFGGPQGVTRTVHAGDAVIIPAGVSHKNLSATDGFGVVGAYPEGQTPDLLRGRREELAAAKARIERVSLPACDPVYGQQWPLGEHWHEAQAGS